MLGVSAPNHLSPMPFYLPSIKPNGECLWFQLRGMRLTCLGVPKIEPPVPIILDTWEFWGEYLLQLYTKCGASTSNPFSRSPLELHPVWFLSLISMAHIGYNGWIHFPSPSCLCRFFLWNLAIKQGRWHPLLSPTLFVQTEMPSIFNYQALICDSLEYIIEF